MEIRQLEMLGLEKESLVPKERFVSDRITSYNVCYTKLLRTLPSPKERWIHTRPIPSSAASRTTSAAADGGVAIADACGMGIGFALGLLLALREFGSVRNNFV